MDDIIAKINAQIGDWNRNFKFQNTIISCTLLRSGKFQRTFNQNLFSLEAVVVYAVSAYNQ